MEPEAFTQACRAISLLLCDCDGVLTDGTLWYGDHGYCVKPFHVHDGMGISLWHKAGLVSGIVSGRRDPSVEKRATDLGMTEIHLGIRDKGLALDDIIARRNLCAGNIAYIGDDINDLVAGLRGCLFFAPCDAHSCVRARADKVLERPGGRGAVREAIEIILTAQQTLEGLIATFTA